MKTLSVPLTNGFKKSLNMPSSTYTCPRPGTTDNWNLKDHTLANRLSSTIGDNREMDQLYTTTSQVSNITRKRNFLTLVDMFFKIK